MHSAQGWWRRGMADAYVVPVWELRPPPSLTPEERRQLGRQHVLRSGDFNDEGEWVLLAAPVCEACGEYWGHDGCATSRALSVLALAEHDRDMARLAEEKAKRALASLGTHAEWRIDAAHHWWEIRYRIAEMALVGGGPDVIDYGLEHVAREMRTRYSTLLGPLVPAWRARG